MILGILNDFPRRFSHTIPIPSGIFYPNNIFNRTHLYYICKAKKILIRKGIRKITISWTDIQKFSSSRPKKSLTSKT